MNSPVYSPSVNTWLLIVPHALAVIVKSAADAISQPFEYSRVRYAGEQIQTPGYRLACSTASVTV